MGMRHQKGFTIIELSLFLAISGLLAITLLTGWTTMINTQRYKDSIKTVQTFLQQQYTLVYNVQNGRNGSTGCAVGPDGKPKFSDETEPAAAKAPGQSGCIVMGRYIHIRNGSEITVYPVVGIDSTSLSDPTDSDKDVMLDRQPVEIKNDLFLTQNDLDIPWQAQVVQAGSDNPMNLAIAIIRNPESGTVHTYVQRISSGLPAVSEVITNSDPGDTNICLDAGVPLAGGRMGVVIRAGASSQSFVQTISDSERLC